MNLIASWTFMDTCGLTAVLIFVGAGLAVYKAYTAVKSVTPEAASAIMPTVGRIALRVLLASAVGYRHRQRG
jgi:hypothetical protein